MSDNPTRREDPAPGPNVTTREGAAPATTREGAAPATTREGPGTQPAVTTRESITPAAKTRETFIPDAASPATAPAPATEDTGGLPQAIFAKYRPERDLPTGGEAHLVMVVRERHGDEQRVAKVYPAAVRPAAALLAALERANPRRVVRVVESGEEVRAYGNEVCWEVQQYVPGGSLAELAAGHGGALPPEVMRQVVREVTDALAYLHGEFRHGTSVGIAHRDIKPENILVLRRNPLELVLCDFGLVAELRATRRTTGRGGTPAYQAPETWWQKSQEPEQDWWSLGVVVVELLTGRNPNSGISGRSANERAIFEHIAKYGVDLDGVTDPGWRLLCQGLLTRSPEERWGAAEVRAWLAGERPAVHDAPIVEPEQPAPRQIAPFEVAGRLCRTPEDIGAAMSENWTAGIAVFSNRDQQLDLSEWMRENFPAVNLPENLMRTKVSGRTDAAARLTKFISWVAPEMPPVFEQRPADAAGIAALARNAAAGDPSAAGLLGNLDVGLLRALARHRCRVHPQCAGDQPGCAVLVAAADRLEQVNAAVQERVNDLAVRLAAGATATGFPALSRRTDVDQQLPVATAVALWLLADPEQHARMAADLRRQKEAARRPWWADLRDEAVRGTDVRQFAAGAVATALIGLAVRETADEKARQAQEKQERRNERAARSGVEPPRGRTLVRNAWRDTVNLLHAVVLAYLTTFAAAAVSKFEAYDADPTGTARYLADVTGAQTLAALPVLVVLGTLLIRPATPLLAARWARRFCWLFAVVLCVLMFSDDSRVRALVRFPIVLQSGVYDVVDGINRHLGGEVFPYAVIAAVILAIVVGARMSGRARGTLAGPDGRVQRNIRAAVLCLIAVLYLIQPLYLWKQWSSPMLPPPTEIWWQW